ncbi:MAG: LysM peptidoglycan-binding domain-containing protein, partial [Dechloromonas sp.]
MPPPRSPAGSRAVANICLWKPGPRSATIQLSACPSRPADRQPGNPGCRRSHERDAIMQARASTMDFPAGLAAPSAIRNPGQGRRRRSRLLLAAVSLLAFAAAGAQEVEYTFKPGDNPWSIAFEHLKPGMVDALVEHNGIRDPYRIAPGTVIRIPDQWLFRGARPVTVVDVGGEAMLIPRRG